MKTIYKISNNPLFEKNGYLYIPNFISDIDQYKTERPSERGFVRYSRGIKVEESEEETQVPGSYAIYGHPKYHDLFADVKKLVQKVLQVSVEPTYYYERYYFPGQSLPKHRDRPSCEISVSVQLQSNCEELWPLWFEGDDQNPTNALMSTGDAVIYKGCELVHWRDPLPRRPGIETDEKDTESFHHQIFFHFVNSDGPFLHFSNEGNA